MKKTLKKITEKFGYSIKKINNNSTPYSDIKDSEFWEIYDLCKPYTMVSIDPMYALYCSVKHILSSDISGSFVECGVWRGGSSMLIAKMLSNRNIVDRKIYLYDTFEGMSEPTKIDIDLRGNNASTLLKENEENKEESVWCLADLSDVQKNMRLTNFPESNMVFIKGKVENTIPENLPKENIALLRLDTDWYESTKHELKYLFPILEQNGILIIDDYGHWEGCRKAVDEYFSENNMCILLYRIDYSVRVGIKTAANNK
ncbi:MAG: TylF/MycF family methyltransferase [Bacteroidetes bacterium]|nr:TylF/MycF family methyltransferase [Bacteroidota bacterium]MBU1719234.1 TylF/MycF family methyltransferase [Bacteroidota bacterium]